MKRLGIAAVGLAAALFVAAALAVVGAFGGGSTAEETVAHQEQAPDINAGGSGEREAARDADGAGENIGVRGNWHVAIYNADGSLDEEHRFQNALRPNGGDALGLLLNPAWNWGGSDGIGNVGIAFGQLDIPNPLGDPVLGVGPCALDITDNAIAIAVQNFYSPVRGRNLLLSSGCLLWTTVTAVSLFPATGPLNEPEGIPGGVRLSGSVTAEQGGSINYVETWLGGFSVVTDPDFDLELYAFTGTSVGPFDVTAGQSVVMTVEITFTTAP